MKKIDIGELVNNAYNTDEVIEYLATTLPTIVDILSKSQTSDYMAGVGAATAQLGNLTSIAKALNERVNGKKEKIVL